MDAAHQLMFALKSPVGLRFGATLQVDAERITFEMDLKIPKGVQCSFRLELSGEDDTVMGTVRIERALPARGGSLPRYVCKILEMPTEDRMRFDGWRRDLATGGVSQRLKRDPEQIRAQISTKMVGGVSEAEPRAVLDRMNAKQSNRRQEEGSVEGDPLESTAEQGDLDAIEQPELREKRGEATPVDVDTTSAASEAGAQIIPPEKPAQVKTSTPAFEPVAAPVAPAPAPAVKVPPPAPAMKGVAPSASRGGTLDISPPIIVVDGDSSPIAITIIYLSDESFIREYDATLHTSAVTVDHPSLTQLYHSVRITIQLADGANISAMGQMVALVPGGMAIAIEFDSAQRAQLSHAAGR